MTADITNIKYFHLKPAVIRPRSNDSDQLVTSHTFMMWNIDSYIDIWYGMIDFFIRVYL